MRWATVTVLGLILVGCDKPASPPPASAPVIEPATDAKPDPTPILPIPEGASEAPITEETPVKPIPDEPQSPQANP